MTELTRARLQVLGAALLFSTGGAAIKSAHFSSWQVAGLRSGVAAIALLLLVPEARRLSLTPGGRGGAAGALGRSAVVAVAYAATLILFVLANKLTTAANTIFLQSTAPVYILLLSPLLLREPIRVRDLGFLAVVAAGMLLFFLGRQQIYATAPDPVRGNLLALASGFTYAALLLGLRWMGKTKGSPAAAVGLGNLFAFLAALPLMLPLGSHPAGDWIVILYLGVFQIALAYVLLARAINHVPAFEASLLLFLEPALNPLWAWLVHGEVPGRLAVAGGVLILVATASKAWWDSRR